MSYRPLPECVTIKGSAIDGLGLFATEDIPANCELGISHVSDERFENGSIRTPLGGFINHSDNPNCVISFHVIQMFHILKTKVDIKAGDEITLEYSLYKVNSV